MRVALIGLPGAGVKTVFSAITELGAPGDGSPQSFGAHRIAVLQVPDPRLDLIAEVFQPTKTVPAAIEVIEFPGLFGDRLDPRAVAGSRESDLLALVLRAFQRSSFPHPRGRVDPSLDLQSLDEEILLADLQIVESRLQRLKIGLGKRKDEEEEQEMQVLERCRTLLEGGQPLRTMGFTEWQSRRLRGFGFLSLKPAFVLLNIGEEQIEEQESLLAPVQAAGYASRAICADIESELARLEEPDREELMHDFGIKELAAPVVIQAIFQALDLVTFYTYSGGECRAWTLFRGQTAVDAAGRVHTDLASGFIRAEVVSFEDFAALGDLKGARAAGKLRLEGRDYRVQDGDLIQVRHSH